MRAGDDMLTGMTVVGVPSDRIGRGVKEEGEKRRRGVAVGRVLPRGEHSQVVVLPRGLYRPKRMSEARQN